MKTILYCLIGFCFVTAHAQDAKYVAAMERTIAQADSAKDIATLQTANNTFERISIANKKEWLPLYYQAFCHVMMGMRQEENSKKDEYFDRAGKLIDQADSMMPENSEIYVLRALITSMKISVDPMTRGQKLGMQSSMLSSKAVELDKENPRAYLIRGRGLMYTPPQYGGGRQNALPVLQMAVEKYKTFKPANSLMPHWGEKSAQQALEECQNME
jgi:hypothetical protein